MPLDLLARARRTLTVQSRIGRELIIFGVALLLGLIAVPLATWLVGNRILGPYVHGSNAHAGPMALLGDFFAGLSQGGVAYWVVALGPAFIILFVRLIWTLINPGARSNPGARPDPQPRPDPGPRVKSNRRIEPTIAKDRL